MAQLLRSMRATFLVIVIAIVIMQCTCGPIRNSERGRVSYLPLDWIGLRLFYTHQMSGTDQVNE
jgi:hypothetical protein